MSLWNVTKTVQQALGLLSLLEGVLGMSEQPQGQQGQQGQQDQQGTQGKRTVFEEVELEGKQLVERVRELLQEGNIRKLIIKDQEGKYLLEIPLTVGVVAGGVFALAAPVMAALGAMAALVARVKIEIVREESGGGEGQGGGEQ